MSPANLPGRPRVVVVGSLNVDTIWNVRQLPGVGETVLALNSRQEFGGKGANQAVAAARQGGHVFLIGEVGRDPEGERYRHHLETEGIVTSGVAGNPGAPTGAAHIYVDERGENMIVVNGGANARLDGARVAQVLGAQLDRTDVLLAQLESPREAVETALRLAQEKGVRTVLNASPVDPSFRWDVPVDTVIVNQHEFAEFFRLPVSAVAGGEKAPLAGLLDRHRIRHLVITRGGASTLHLSAEGVEAVAAHPVVPLDTVGAGDTFAGTLAVALAQGLPWADALWRANVAAALSTQVAGVQTAIPTLAAVQGVLNA